MVAENLVKKALYLYLNPRRTDLDKLSLKLDTNPWHIAIDRPIYDYFNSIDLHLTFKMQNTEEGSPVAEICDIFFKELNNLNLNIDIGIYNIIKSLLLFFYFPLSYVNNNKSLVVNKAIALFQLSKNYPELNRNNRVRTAYIKFLFFNAHLYEEVQYLKLNNGKLYYKKNILSDDLNNLLLIKNTSVLFNNVINYCTSIINFLENGFQGESLITSIGIDDMYMDYIFYNFFIEKGKSYKHKKMIEILFEMQSYPNYGYVDFLNKIFLFNFTNLVKNTDIYIQKYLDEEFIKSMNINDRLSEFRYPRYFK